MTTIRRPLALFLVLLALSLLPLSAQVTVDPLPYLAPKDAKTMGMGGTFLALSSGYQSFFGNPAGFGLRKGSLTLANANAWAYVKPTQENLGLVQGILGEDPVGAAVGLASNLVTKGGVGAGASVGLGYAGHGLGLGAFVVNEEYISGATLLGAKVSTQTQVNLVLGLAVPIGTPDFNLTIGGDIRPFYRVDGEWSFSDVLGIVTGDAADPEAMVMELPARAGFGVMADLGATLTLGSLSAGLVIRDIAPMLSLNESTLGEVVASFESGGGPAGSGAEIPVIPNITAGASFAPRLIPGLIDLKLYAELQDALRVIVDEDSPWKLLHAGGELRLLSFIYGRAGINRGWYSLGAGIDLLFIEIDAAVFTEELGRTPGAFGRSGFALQAALRF